MRIVDYVDPIIGTAGSGKAIVGPQMPHGMVKLSPDTISLPNAGYDYRDTRICCFSHTHLEGVGGRGGRGVFGVMPVVGPFLPNERCYASAFCHERETAKVGYYAVDLLDYGIHAELTATLHSGLHTYTFPAGNQSYILFDMGHTTGLENRTIEAHIHTEGDNALAGWGLYPSSAYGDLAAPAYFYAELSKPFSEAVFFDADPEDPEILPSPALKLGLSTYNRTDVRGKVKKITGNRADSNRALAALRFITAENEQICVRIGVSFISEEQAKENLRHEIPDFDQSAVVAKCQDAWEKALSVLQVNEPDDKKKKIFYSAIYRALNQPTEYTEYGKFCIAADGKDKMVFTKQRFYADDWAIWDTFRTTNPLQVLLEPERASDIVQSLVEYYKDCGWLPTCPAPARGINTAMVGHNYDSMILDAYTKGCRNFDTEKAYEAMRKAATDYSTIHGIKADYKELGYIPADTSREGDFCVTETAEYIYADWCTAKMAEALGKTDDAVYFFSRAQNYKKLFDPVTKLFRRRNKDGSFTEPFDPNACFKHGYCESSAWEATFFVPHDPQGLINLFGSDQAFVNQLDEVFKRDRHNFENETSLHLPFMYIYAGRSDRTADIIREYLVPTFTDEPDGLYGEDDNGAMSAFNAFAWLGIYPQCPGRNEYVLFSPYVQGWQLKNPDGSVFSLTTENNSEENRYIQRITLNGVPYPYTYITHEALRRGGKMVVIMGPEPSDFGTSPESLPHSESKRDCKRYEETDETILSDLRSDRMVRSVEDKTPFTLSAEVFNDRKVPFTEQIRLVLDGQCVQTQRVALKPYQKVRVTFQLKLKAGHAHSADIQCDNCSGCKPILLEVCGQPSSAYITFANIPAVFYQGERHLYIEAAGDQGQEHYGEIFLRDPIKGDFDAIVKLVYKDVSSPYAPAGIVVRNEINDPIRYGFKGGMYMGAMCTRGFYSYLGGDVGCDESKTNWAMGVPSIPCWLKIEKRGKHFRGLFSNDGVHWTVKSSGEIPYAAEMQYVGIYSRSCIHEKKLAAFEGGIMVERIPK